MRVLIVRVGAMGDVLHGLPAVAALRRAIPDCFIGWAVEPRWRALLETGGEMAGVSQVHEVPAKQWKRRPFSLATVRGIARLRRELRAEQYDVCVDLQGSLRSAVIGRMSGARRLVGADEPRERVARALYGERVELRESHVIEQGCELVGAGAGLRLKAAEVALPHDAAAEAWCEGRLRELGVAGEFVLLAPTAGWGAKQWPGERYRDLAKRLKRGERGQKGLPVLVNVAPGERPDMCVRCVVKGGDALPVECALAELIALTRRAAVVVGGDTGPVHLAAALGRRVVALFGPTGPVRNGPYFPGAKVRVIRHGSSTTDHRRHTETEAGLAKISVEDVMGAALELLGTGGGKERRGVHG